MPGERAQIEQAIGLRQQRLLRPRDFSCHRFAEQLEPPERGEEDTGVELRRSLPELLPVEQARALAEVEDMMGIERAVHQAWGALLRLRSHQPPGQFRRDGSQRGIGGVQSGDPFAGLFQPAYRAQRRPELDFQRGRAPYPARGRSEEHTSELQSHHDLVCRLLLEKKKHTKIVAIRTYSYPSRSTSRYTGDHD